LDGAAAGRGGRAGHRFVALRRARRVAARLDDVPCRLLRAGPFTRRSSGKGGFMHTSISAFGRSRIARRRAGQAGFSLVEVSIVTAIVLLIAVIGIPAIGGYVMENKVPKVGQELARFVMHVRV